jgi:hypothetical protein
LHVLLLFEWDAGVRCRDCRPHGDASAYREQIDNVRDDFKDLTENNKSGV